MGRLRGSIVTAAPFSIYCDEDTATPDSAYGGSTFDESFKLHNSRADSPVESIELVSIKDEASGPPPQSPRAVERQQRTTDGRIDSARNISPTSISSLPDSTLESENECENLVTPTKPRSPLRTPVKSCRSTLAVPSPRSVRSIRSIQARGSPRPRTRERHEEKETDRLMLPLVLLQVNVLPTSLPWSRETLDAFLPNVLGDHLALLRSKLSPFVLDRGLLVPHPRDDFELLEERVLAALELKTPRSHYSRFVNHNGLAAYTFDGESHEAKEPQPDNDSDSETVHECETCGRVMLDSEVERMQWELKVYAANGLMRTEAWAAAWPEMERIDVEILPRFPHAVRRKLDRAQAEEDRRLESERFEEEAEQTMLRLAHAQAQFAEEERRMREEQQDIQLKAQLLESEALAGGARSAEQPQQRPCKTQSSHVRNYDDFPAAYRVKDVPVRVLLWNYFYLLMQDRRNAAIAFLALTVVFACLPGMWTAQNHPIHSLMATNCSSLAGMANTQPQLTIVMNEHRGPASFSARALPVSADDWPTSESAKLEISSGHGSVVQFGDSSSSLVEDVQITPTIGSVTNAEERIVSEDRDIVMAYSVTRRPINTVGATDVVGDAGSALGHSMQSEDLGASPETNIESCRGSALVARPDASFQQMCMI